MRDLRICFVGDSFVNGTGDDDCLGWSGRICRSALARGVMVTRYDLGVRRDTSTLIRNRCAGEVAVRLDAVKCDGRVVFSFGVNDVAEEDGRLRVARAETLENARALLAWSRERYPTLMVGPAPVAGDAAHDARAAALAPALGSVCAEFGVPYLDWHRALAVDPTWREEVLAGDGAHPNSGGYGRAAELVEAWPAWRGWIDAR